MNKLLPKKRKKKTDINTSELRINGPKLSRSKAGKKWRRKEEKILKTTVLGYIYKKYFFNVKVGSLKDYLIGINVYLNFKDRSHSAVYNKACQLKLSKGTKFCRTLAASTNAMNKQYENYKFKGWSIAKLQVLLLWRLWQTELQDFIDFQFITNILGFKTNVVQKALFALRKKDYIPAFHIGLARIYENQSRSHCESSFPVINRDRLPNQGEFTLVKNMAKSNDTTMFSKLLEQILLDNKDK